MPISVSGTQITFNDSTTQATAASNGIQGLSVFNSPGTFAAPPSTTKIYIVAASGGGGDGGGSFIPEGGSGGGFGGPGVVGVGVYSVTGGSNYPVTVGAAGNNGTTNNGGGAGTAGGAGGASSVGNLLTCNGGNGGNQANSTGSGGTPGNPGTAPLATTSAAAYGEAPVTSQVGSPGDLTVSVTAGKRRQAGKVLIYF